MSPVVASALGASGSERHEGSQGGVMPPPASAHVPSADDGPERHVSAPSAPMSGATPPIGTPPTAVTPPIAVPTPGGPVTPRVEPASSPPAAAAPKVEVFDEETYLCQPGDTFDKISQAHYHTENYAKALLQFNIDHPLANDKVRRNPPVLEPGQAVYIPPTRILESRYGAFYIPGYKPAQQQSAAPGSALPARNDHSANASPGVAANTSAVYPQYRVQGQGETMREIARATLGSAERWSEIYKLNPDYRPEFRVPGGTALRLPSDARVDPANVAR
jgi:nucleoid-associated protein YgaU